MQNFDLKVKLAGVTLKNPVMTASGTYGFGEEYAPFYDPSLLGAITVKGITPLPRLGNPVPRLAETPAGILNSVGLENPGLDIFVKEYLPRLKNIDTAVIVNISVFSIEDSQTMAEAFQKGCGIAALEVNISCPNIKHGGMAFGTDPRSAEEVISAVRKKTDLPLIAKLSPNVTSITDMAKAVESGGADMVSLINTLLGMSIDIYTQKPVLANKVGGLSGPAVRPVAVRMVYQVYESIKIPIIGMGGIMTWQDAVEFMLAGASAVSIGTANFSNPLAPVEIIKSLQEYAISRKYSSVQDIIGAAH
jgi:dihydroorotate dehydrogenase (NAD+) catalytic subunit